MIRTHARHTFRAFRHRNYRLFFGGQLVSMTGTWLTRVATSWLVYSLSHSALMLGLVSCAGQLPTFLLAPVAGVLVDRWNRHRVLVVTQILAMLQSAGLAALTLAHSITIPHILLLSIMQGVINAFDTPARQSFVVEMVTDRADLSNAIALNSSLVNLARLLGPSLAGILIALVGVGGCFSIDAVSYLAVIWSLLRMTTQGKKGTARTDRRALLSDLRDGFSYVWGFKPLRYLLLLTALISFMGMPYAVLLPIIADRQLGGGASLLGYLSAAAGLGALSGALYLAARKSVVGLGKVVPAASILFAAGLVGLGLSRSVWLSLPAAMVIGLGMITQLASTNTLLQTITEEDKRGRVMSYYTMAFFGMAPFGSLFAGWAAHILSAPVTLAAGGAACLAGGLLFFRELPALKEQVRPVYVQKGILPPLERGLENAALDSLPPET